MPINSKWWCSNAFHTSNLNVGSSQWWSTASTMSSCHHFIVATVTPKYQHLGQLCQWNCGRVHPYAYPQHMMVLKHFIYIQYACGMQSVVVCNLNHDTMTQFVIRLTPIFQNLVTTSTGITVLWCTNVPIHSIWRCSNTLYTSNMDVGCSQQGFAASFMTPQCHLGSALPKFPKICPHPPQV